MDKLHIITVATESKYYFPYLVESCKRNGKELKILGYGEKWEGFNWKYVKMIDHLKTLPNDHIVCFVDGYDVICCRNLNEITNEFLKIKENTGCKMVVAVDNGNIINKILGKFFFGECKGQQINSGTYIGYVSDILEIIEKIYKLNPKNNADDQVLMTIYCKENNKEIYIDSKNELFLTLIYPLQEIDKYVEINEKNNILTYNLNRPFFVHANGYGYLDGVISKLGYDIKGNDIKNELFSNILEKKIWHYFKEIIFLYYYFIIIFIFLLCYLCSYTYVNKQLYNFYKNNKNYFIKKISYFSK
jgi:hypothetical protein